MPQFPQSFLNHWQPFAGRVTATVLALLLVALCAVEVGRSIAALRFQPDPIRMATASIDPQQLVQRITAAHLFGRAGDAGSDTQRRSLPETSLQLTLRGAFAGSNATQGSAIIELQQGMTRSIRAGDTIDRDTHLREVYADHVVLERAGQFESLYFPQPGAADQRSISGAIASIPASPPAGQQSADVQALIDAGLTGDNRREPDYDSGASPMSSDERREMIRQRLEELRQRASSNRTLP